MHSLPLPDPRPALTPAFQDLAGAERWLAAQPVAQPQAMLSILTGQIEAIDAAGMPPAQGIRLLEHLGCAAIPAQAALEARYMRKALPLLGDDQQIFNMAQRLWTQLAIAYLRQALHGSASEKALPLHRAANAIRQAQFCHYQASHEAPLLLDQLLFAVLQHGEAAGVLREPLTDPCYPHLGPSNIAGLLAWALLLRLSDPYHFSGAQLAVANRALSRWRELCAFQHAPDDDPKARAVSLAKLLGGALPAGIPGWLNVRPVSRKIRSRIESLHAGESPESLKLGRELSAAACIRLLTDIDQHLRETPPAPLSPEHPIELAFGAEHAYALFAGEELNPKGGITHRSNAIAHQRMAVFGFDNVAQLATAVQKIEVPGETWQSEDGQVTRGAKDGPRLQAPCLVATRVGTEARLGVLSRLVSRHDGRLSARISWYTGRIEACTLKRPPPIPPNQPRHAAFLIRDGDILSLLVPIHAGTRLEIGLELEGGAVRHLVPREVIERGTDFVRYACRPA